MALSRWHNALLSALVLLISAESRAEEVWSAAVEFQLPTGFESLQGEPPFLITGVKRRLSSEQARIRFFIPPIPASSNANEALAAVRYIFPAAGTVVDKVENATFDGEGIASERIDSGDKSTILMVRRLDDRCAAIALTGKQTTVIDVLSDTRAALKAARSADVELPTSPGLRFGDAAVGLTLTLPLLFSETERSGAFTELARYAFPSHNGIPAAAEIALMTDALDRPLEEAAKLERERVQAQNAANVISTFESYLGRLPSWRIRYDSADLTFDTLLIDTARHRVRVTFAFSTARARFFNSAIERCLSEIKPLQRRIGIERNERFSTQDGMISIQPPHGFLAREGDGDLLTFEQVAVKPPRAEIHIRLAGTHRNPAKNAAEAIERGTSRRSQVLTMLSDSGFVAVGDVTEQYIGGNLAARYRFERTDGAQQIIDARTMLHAGGRDYEISVLAERSEYDLMRPLFESAIGSFKANLTTRSTQLQAPTLVADGAWSIAAPEDWIATAAKGKSEESVATLLARFEPAEPIPGAELRVESLALPISTNPLIGRKDRLRSALFSDLEKEGASVVRVESLAFSDPRLRAVSTSTDAPTQHYLQLAFSLRGLDVKELCFAQFKDDIAYVARARCAVDHFHENRALLLNTISSLAAKSP